MSEEKSQRIAPPLLDEKGNEVSLLSFISPVVEKPPEKEGTIKIHPERHKYDALNAASQRKRQGIAEKDIKKEIQKFELDNFSKADPTNGEIFKDKSLELVSYPKTVLGKINVSLLDKYLNDDVLLKRHLDLLEGRILIKKYDRGGNLIEERIQYDNNAISKALDMAYRIKGYYGKSADFSEIDVQIQQKFVNVNVKEMKDEDIDKFLESKFNKIDK